MLEFRARDWRWVALWTIAIVAVAISLPLRWMQVAITVMYSSSWTSASSADSRRSGLFVAAPLVRDSLVSAPDGEYRILDVWIEERTHHESLAVFFTRTVRDGHYSLIVVTEMPADASYGYKVGILEDSRSQPGTADTLRFAEWTGTRERHVSKRTVEQPFPASLRFVAVAR